jgi:putative phosphoribosyl transferase
MRFKDRTSAGQMLAAELKKLALKTPIVFALPRGGVPVAKEVATALQAPLDLLFVRKIGVPWQPELAAASIVDGETPDLVLNEDVMRMANVTREQIDAAAKVELREIERRRALYMKDRAPAKAEGHEAILVDDGIATGASLKAAIAAVRRRKPTRVIVATPVAPDEAVTALRALADDVVCLSTPPAFYAIGVHYDDFHQLTDKEVADHLKEAAAPEGKADGPTA